MVHRNICIRDPAEEQEGREKISKKCVGKTYQSLQPSQVWGPRGGAAPSTGHPRCWRCWFSAQNSLSLIMWTQHHPYHSTQRNGGSSPGGEAAFFPPHSKCSYNLGCRRLSSNAHQEKIIQGRIWNCLFRMPHSFLLFLLRSKKRLFHLHSIQEKKNPTRLVWWAIRDLQCFKNLEI